MALPFSNTESNAESVRLLLGGSKTGLQFTVRADDDVSRVLRPLLALQRHHATAQGWRLSDLKQKLPSSVLVYEFTA